MSEHDSISITRRKGMQDTRREIPAYADPIYSPSLKQTDIPLQVIHRKLTDVHIDTLDQDINMDFEQNSPYPEDVKSKTYQRPNKSYFREPTEQQGLVSTSKLVQRFFTKTALIEKILKIIKKSSKGNSFTCNCKGNTCRIHNQPIL